MYTEIERCRICSNTNLTTILHLGNQVLTGVFPKSKDEVVSSGPLELVKCMESKNNNFCGLVQLKHSFDLHEIYGENYGYRSGLNQSMVNHLRAKVAKILNTVSLEQGDMVLDIGSNDATLLKAYPDDKFILVGIDPTGKKFHEFYPSHIHLIPEFFSASIIKNTYGSKKAKVVTSIAMFYDLESPINFMREVHEILEDEGIWIFEQSYMPAMLKVNGYDTICHEHLEYYGLKQIKWMADRVGFKIIDIEISEVNGGSFSVTVAKANASYRENKELIRKLLQEEEIRELGTLKPYKRFRENVFRHRERLRRWIYKIKRNGKSLIGYGASTKGNVILQFCGITKEDIPYIAEVNADKFGRYTPGTLIPIISEKEARAMKPDYFMVLPWHFRENIVRRENVYLKGGGKLLFPLPRLDEVHSYGS